MVIFSQLPPFNSIIRYVGYNKHETNLVVGLQNGQFILIGSKLKSTVPGAVPTEVAQYLTPKSPVEH